MFAVDPILKEPFVQDDIIAYKRVAALIPSDMPMILVAPAFVSTANGTDLLSNHLQLGSLDAQDWYLTHRYEAYIGSCWVDAPTVAVTLVTSKLQYKLLV